LSVPEVFSGWDAGTLLEAGISTTVPAGTGAFSGDGLPVRSEGEK
jgi:hypothetical protein